MCDSVPHIAMRPRSGEEECMKACARGAGAPDANMALPWLHS